MSFPIFVTARGATTQKLNRALIHLDTWNEKEEPYGRTWGIIYSASLEQLGGDEIGELPLSPDVARKNEFVGKSIHEINEWVVDHAAALAEFGMEDDEHIWLVLDDEGLATDTVLVVTRCARYFWNEQAGKEDIEETRSCRWFRLQMSETHNTVMATCTGAICFDECVEQAMTASPGPYFTEPGGPHTSIINWPTTYSPEGRRNKNECMHDARIKGWIAGDD